MLIGVNAWGQPGLPPSSSGILHPCKLPFLRGSHTEKLKRTKGRWGSSSPIRTALGWLQRLTELLRMVLPDTAAVGACPGLVLPANGSESRPTTAQQCRAAEDGKHLALATFPQSAYIIRFCQWLPQDVAQPPLKCPAKRHPCLCPRPAFHSPTPIPWLCPNATESRKVTKYIWVQLDSFYAVKKVQKGSLGFSKPALLFLERESGTLLRGSEGAALVCDRSKSGILVSWPSWFGYGFPSFPQKVWKISLMPVLQL